MRPRRWLRVALLATTILGAPGLAYADPVSLTAIAATAAGGAVTAATTTALGATLAAVLGAVVTGVLGFAGNQLFGTQDPSAQVSSRARKFDPHPPIRFPFGAVPLEGSVVFHHVDGELYYAVYLLGSIPCDSITRIEINDGLHLPLQDPDKLKVMNDPNIDYKGGSDVDDSFNDFKNGRIVFWFGDGEHTQPPQLWIDEIGDVITATDIWKGVACMFVRIDHSSNVNTATKLWTHGKPPPLRFFGKWSKLYDPRKDPNSGVTQYVSGAHDFDDPTTWDWSANAALAGLMLATHRLALGISTEVIPIQQWADAADDCGVCRASLADAALYIALDVSGSMDGAKIEAQATAVSNLLTEIKALADADEPNDIRIVLYNDGVVDSIERRDADDADYDALIAFAEGATTASGGTDFQQGVASASTFFDGAGSKERLLVFTTDGVPEPESSATTAETTLDGISNLSRYAFNIELSDTTFTELIDNTPIDGVPVVPAGDPDLLAIEFLGALGLNRLRSFCCDGVVTIKQRELELLDPVLACMAGHLDTTDGLLGVRAGVWVAPTETLPQPIGDEVEVKGARDAGFDTIRSTFIGPDSDWSEEDGPGYVLRAGNRVGPLPLPLVGDRTQAHRLEKIAALRAEPRITVDGLWDGQQAHRRIGERVNFSLSGLPRSSSSFVIIGKEIITQAVDDGAFELSTRLTLQEDLARTYAFTAEDVPAASESTILDPQNDPLSAPTSVTLEQVDYQSAAGATARLKITVAITQALSERAGTLRIETTDGSGYTHLIDMEVSAGTLSYVAYLKPAEVGVTYTGRARAESAFLGVSDYTTSNSLTIVAPVLDYDSADYSAEYA